MEASAIADENRAGVRRLARPAAPPRALESPSLRCGALRAHRRPKICRHTVDRHRAEGARRISTLRGVSVPSAAPPNGPGLAVEPPASGVAALCSGRDRRREG
uniref:Uncharacterized protein n=1 Tax=Cryptomonas curvata TaxID=233186 RepID=A0A7S0M4L5_9CRYP